LTISRIGFDSSLYRIVALDVFEDSTKWVETFGNKGIVVIKSYCLTKFCGRDIALFVDNVVGRVAWEIFECCPEVVVEYGKHGSWHVITSFSICLKFRERIEDACSCVIDMTIG